LRKSLEKNVKKFINGAAKMKKNILKIVPKTQVKKVKENLKQGALN
jgi:hypothetical protein